MTPTEIAVASANRLLVVLDLNGCLLSRAACNITRPPAAVTRAQQSAVLRRAGTVAKKPVFLRPGLSKLMRALVVSRNIDVAVWTSASEDTADKLWSLVVQACVEDSEKSQPWPRASARPGDVVPPARPGLPASACCPTLVFRMTRDHCKHVACSSCAWATIKDLDTLFSLHPRFTLARTLIFEDSPFKVKKSPANAIILPTWNTGVNLDDAAKDGVLERLAQYVHMLDENNPDDVRDWIKQRPFTLLLSPKEGPSAATSSSHNDACGGTQAVIDAAQKSAHRNSANTASSSRAGSLIGGPPPAAVPDAMMTSLIQNPKALFPTTSEAAVSRKSSAADAEKRRRRQQQQRRVVVNPHPDFKPPEIKQDVAVITSQDFAKSKFTGMDAEEEDLADEMEAIEGLKNLSISI